MAPVQHYTGALPPKKKSELQDIAVALRLSDQGTKEELQNRIKKHLDEHQSELEEDPVFAGLFGRRKRSVQPQSTTVTTTRVAEVSLEAKPPSGRPTRRSGALEPIYEATPVKDLRDVSANLKHPISPVESSEQSPPPHDEGVSSSRVPSEIALRGSSPPSPPPRPTTQSSPAKALMENVRNTVDVAAITHELRPYVALQMGTNSLITTRRVLSNARNIWSLTALAELLYILYAVIPWKSFELHIPPNHTVSVPFAPLSIFSTSAFWSILLHWSLSTVVVPAVVGTLISFNPVNTPKRGETKDAVVFDPLTASIVRLAAEIAYPFSSVETLYGIHGLDVLGSRWRILSASLTLAFALAETISGAPQAFALALREGRFTTPSRAATPARM